MGAAAPLPLDSPVGIGESAALVVGMTGLLSTGVVVTAATDDEEEDEGDAAGEVG